MSVSCAATAAATPTQGAKATRAPRRSASIAREESASSSYTSYTPGSASFLFSLPNLRNAVATRAAATAGATVAASRPYTNDDTPRTSVGATTFRELPAFPPVASVVVGSFRREVSFGRVDSRLRLLVPPPAFAKAFPNGALTRGGRSRASRRRRWRTYLPARRAASWPPPSNSASSIETANAWGLAIDRTTPFTARARDRARSVSGSRVSAPRPRATSSVSSASGSMNATPSPSRKPCAFASHTVTKNKRLRLFGFVSRRVASSSSAGTTLSTSETGARASRASRNLRSFQIPVEGTSLLKTRASSSESEALSSSARASEESSSSSSSPSRRGRRAARANAKSPGAAASTCVPPFPRTADTMVWSASASVGVSTCHALTSASGAVNRRLNVRASSEQSRTTSRTSVSSPVQCASFGPAARTTGETRCAGRNRGAFRASTTDLNRGFPRCSSASTLVAPISDGVTVASRGSSKRTISPTSDASRSRAVSTPTGLSPRTATHARRTSAPPASPSASSSAAKSRPRASVSTCRSCGSRASDAMREEKCERFSRPPRSCGFIFGVRDRKSFENVSSLVPATRRGARAQSAPRRASARMSLTHAFAVVASNLRRVRTPEDAARLYAAFLLYIVRSSLR